MYYVYILKREINNGLCIGYTEDLKRRIKQHKYKGDCRLIYYEAYFKKETARSRERKLKHYGSAWRALKERITA
jgi:predicted GIY-YIG superfamily endonuclease